MKAQLGLLTPKPPPTLAGLCAFLKGDVPGHEFHGNQWTGGAGMQAMFSRISAPDGGFTYQPTSRSEPSTGFALSIFPDRSFAKAASEVTMRDLTRYVAANRDLLKQPSNYLGGWHDPVSGKMFLDVSRVTQDRSEAAHLARENDQIAYFDIGAGKSIDVNRNATSGGALKSDDGQARASLAAWRTRLRREGTRGPVREDDGTESHARGIGRGSESPGRDAGKVDLGRLLGKEWSAPTSPTAGIQPFGSSRPRRSIDYAAHAAATSDLNLLRKPTAAQAEAGNYRKGHIRVAGLDISIENPAGSHRRPEWPPLSAHYGYFRGTEGADGDHVDCFVRPGTAEDWTGDAYVIDQPRPDGKFDEHKVMLGYGSQDEAIRAYLANYTPGWRLGPVTAVPVAGLRDWLRRGDTKAPLQRTLRATMSGT